MGGGLFKEGGRKKGKGWRCKTLSCCNVTKNKQIEKKEGFREGF